MQTHTHFRYMLKRKAIKIINTILNNDMYIDEYEDMDIFPNKILEIKRNRTQKI